MANGIDISSHNHNTGAPFNWADCKRAGFDYVWVKSTQGVGYLNPYCIADCRDAMNNGLKVGTYHFYDNTGTPEAQADHFLRNGVRQVKDFCVLHPVLDWEEPAPHDGNLRNRFLNAMGMPTGVYMARNYQSDIGYGASAAFGWLAWPGWNGEPVPANTAMVQDSWTATVPGIGSPCDTNVITNAVAISTVIPTPVPIPEGEEQNMTTVTINGTEYVVSTVVTKAGHVVQIRQDANSVGLPSTSANTNIIDLTAQWPAELS